MFHSDDANIDDHKRFLTPGTFELKMLNIFNDGVIRMFAEGYEMIAQKTQIIDN